MRPFKELLIRCTAQARLSGPKYIMPEGAQELNGDLIDILIGQEFHSVPGAARWISSVLTRSRAYRMQAFTSSTVMSG